MKVAIVGGKLQGTEAIYLAKKAGYYSILIDINENVMAAKLSDCFVCGDLIKRDENVIKALKEADVILPAMENMAVIKAIEEISMEYNLLVAFDFEAYMVTQSKLKSDELFKNNNIPAPIYYPNCEPPYILKPICESGSHGVRKITDINELKAIGEPSDYIIQEYLEGPSYSIEVIGDGRDFRTYEITEIHMDDKYDCKMVTAPLDLPYDIENNFREIAIKIAKIIKLNGIMDVEVILNKGELKVLEIDARMPSQTPSVVLGCSGINLLMELVELKLNGRFPELENREKRYCVYENFSYEKGMLKNEGEHIMSDAGFLKIESSKYGYDDIIWDYISGNNFRGIFINSSESEDGIIKDRNNLVGQLKELS